MAFTTVIIQKSLVFNIISRDIRIYFSEYLICIVNSSFWNTWLMHLVCHYLGGILKSRNIILLTKTNLVKAMVFPVVIFGCESWTIKKTEHWRIDAFELWCWRILLRVTWTARRCKRSILKEISLDYSLEGLILKLKLQTLATWWEELTHWERPWC